jgi:glycosyltransferase involved in cell wall biosynthesis
LIVVDDGERFPVDPDAVASLGGKLVRVPPDTPLGSKLNHGVRAARGVLCQKMDDDDWYAPDFLAAMVSSRLERQAVVCRPTISFLRGFLFFDLARWEIRRSREQNVPGATLMFAREDWEECEFRPLRQDEDVWFYLDQIRAGAAALPVHAPETFLAVRHRGASQDRGHTWVQQWDGRPLESYLLDRPLHEGGPESLLPEWALQFYRSQRELLCDRS